MAVIVVVVFGSYYYFTRNLPSLKNFEEYHPNLVTKVYSQDGRVIGEFFIEKRVVVPIEKMPRHLIHAFLAAEDHKFFEHEGISYTGIFRAFYKNLLAGKVVQGGSTITQQLAKSFLGPERKLSRKIREVIMAYRIEKHLTKDEILNLYLNQIYFGNGAYGIETASEAYFGKNVEDLDLAESAMLAGLPKAPTRYSPYANFTLAKKRQEFILNRMAEEKYITLAEARRAAQKKLRFKPKRAESLWVGPYFTEHVRRYVEDKYGEDTLYRGGLEVYTTLDVEMQKAANVAVSEGIRDYDKRRGYRGPVAVLKSKEDLAKFNEEAEKRLSGVSIEPGLILQGVVASVNTRDMTLLVDLGGRRGIINGADMEWARLYNTSNSPDGGRRQELQRTFHAGDVIEVMVKSAPADGSSLIPLKLEQEPVAQAALLAMDPATGAVKAMVGGVDFSRSQFNRAIQAQRQPGSSFKPIIYTAAMDRNYTPASIVVDSPLVFEEAMKDEKWRPRNYDEQFLGPTTVRDGLARSRNVVTVKILKDIGVDYAISYARLLGIQSPLARDLSIALGSSAVSLLEMTTAFSTLDNMGVRPDPLFITRITDSAGNVLEENSTKSTPVISPQTAYIMTTLLQSVIDYGTGQRAKSLGRPAAGKTGTTNNLNDAWFIGYVPGLATGAWIGYDDEKPLGRGETGGRAALPIWLKFMKGATSTMPVRNFQAPDGLEYAKIDPETGLLAGPATADAVFEVFKAGTAPAEASTDKGKSHAGDFFMMDTGSTPARVKRAEPEEEYAD